MRRVYKTKTPWPGGWFRHMVPFMRCPFKKSLLVGVIIFRKPVNRYWGKAAALRINLYGSQHGANTIPK